MNHENVNRPPSTPSAPDTRAAVTRVRDAVRARRDRRTADRRLHAELGHYRTARERLELEAMLSRGAEREVEAINHLLHAGRRAA